MKTAESHWDGLIRDCFLHPRDERPLTRFFDEFSPYLRAILVSTFSRDLSIVEDALQSAFVKFLIIFRSEQKVPLHIGYFVVIAKNCLIDELRRRKGYVSLDEVAETELPNIPAPEMNAPEIRMMLLQNALLQMDARCRFILESYYVNEVDAHTLATELRISPDSVYMAIKRCRDKLRGILSPLAG